MALSTVAKEQDNFLRYAILIVDHSKEALQDLIELNLRNKHLSFEEFLNQNQHEIYHLCYDSKCCQCHTSPPRRKRIIYPSQFELLLEKHNKLPCHKTTNCNDFCCSKSKVGITTDVLDISLARCLLVNCCLDVFWFTCLTAQGQTLEQFLNLNKHIIYHLWKNNQKCCQCPAGFIFPRDYQVITENEWRGMFNSVLLPCIKDRKRTSTGTTSVCSVAARPGIDVTDIHPQIQGLILKWCCSVRNSVDKLVEFRNINYGHVTNATLSDSNFKDFSKKTEEWILHIASYCKKDKIVKDVLTNLHSRPIDARLCSHYQNVLLENINRNEALYENIDLQHRTTRKSIPGLVDKSLKMRKMEKRIDDLEASNAKIKKDIHDIHKLVKEGPNRQRLIDQTSAEIETHEKDVTYVEIEAVRHCIQLLQSRNVVILSGREGSGKSRNGLEILRQVKENRKDVDVFKLIGLTYVSDIVKNNVTSIVLFDNAFDKTFEPFSNDKHILDHLYSYMTLNKVKLIFTMRNTVRHACHRLLSTHRLFHDLLDIDLNSEKFKLTKVEKEKILTNYCDINKIKICDRVGDKTNQSVFHEAGIDDKETIQTVSDQVSVFVNIEIKNEIIKTDPFLGYPECCRLFTENRNNTTLDATIFKWPSPNLVKDIEKWRFEGEHDFTKGLKYVALVYILTIGRSDGINEYNLAYNSEPICSLQEKNIDVKVCKEILKECCNKNSEVYEHKIKYALDELMAGCYLVKKNGTYYFQHPALEDTILVSYSKINTKAIIPLLSFDHMMDLVRLHDYIEQENEIFVKIQKKYYYDLAIHFISLCHKYGIKLMDCSTFAKNDIDFIYQLLLCFNDKSETSLLLKSINHELLHYFPLCLLQNIGKLDDNKLTANHTQDQLLISMVIEDQTIPFVVDPCESLLCALQEKNEQIIIWLAKNTDHSLLALEMVVNEYIIDTCIEPLLLLLQNFDHDQFDMTTLLSYVCIYCFNKENHILDWMMDNINNSLINNDTLFKSVIFTEGFDLEEYFNLILYIRNKVNRKLFDVSKAVQMWCIYRGTEIVQRVLQDVDNKILDEEELIDIMIDNNKQKRYIYMHGEQEEKNEKIVEQLLQTNGIQYHDLNQLVCVASESGWLNVLDLLFKHDVDKSFHKDKVREHILKLLGNGMHCEKTIRHIMKYYLDYINVNILMEKAVDVGCHSVVEELLLKKVDNISYLLDITLDKLRHQQLSHGFKIFESDHGKILLLLLQKNNTKLIDLNSIMNDVCHIGHSPAIQWLLENKPSFVFDIRKVMNNACFHGDLELVDYLFQKYSAVDFDYKTAMIKACRHAQCNTLDVCKWLWRNIDRSMFDIKAALNNASKYDNTENVKWILTDVDTELYDIDAAVLCASEHGNEDTLQMLLNQAGINMLDIQSALTLSCRNDHSCLRNAKLLYRRANKSNLDMNAVLSEACKYYRTDFIQWIIETCDKNITVFKTSDGHKHFIKSFDKHRVDMDQAVTCILDMDYPAQKKDHVNKTKKQLLIMIIKQSDSSTIHIYTLLAETCENDWVEIFQWILEKVDHARLNIGEIINVACRFGAFKIVKWSLENIDMQLVDVDNVLVESCGFGWLECLVLILKHCNQYKLQEAMTEACSYGRLHIAEWILQNVHYQLFNIPMLLQEAGRNGWIKIFGSLLHHFNFDESDMQIATSQALENGHLEIAKQVISKVGKDCFRFSSLSENTYAGANKEDVVIFLLHNIDHRSIDIATIMTNACLFGWKDVATFIVDNDLTSLCDLSLGFNAACDNGELEIAQLLLEKVDTRTLIAVDKAMHAVAVKGWDEIALLLLDKVEHPRLDIGNALIEACKHGEIDVVQAILRKVDNNMIDVKTAINKACENHMYEDLVLWILENINQEQVDLKSDINGGRFNLH